MRPRSTAAVATAARIRGRVSRGHRGAASTTSRCRSRPHACGQWLVQPLWFGSVPGVNPYWFVGAAAALWAVILTFALGLRREDFPSSDRQQRTVMLISALLVAGAIGTAVYGGIQGLGENHGFRHGPEPAKKSEK